MTEGSPGGAGRWDVNAAVKEIVSEGGIALIIGATDSGKTTFVQELGNATVATGRIAAVVDADIGQSEIGPPGCVGLAVCDKQFRIQDHVSPSAMAFVGSTAPRGCMLEHAVAVRRMVDAAHEAAPDLVIVDTTGYVRGPGARRLKQAKIDLLQPDFVVALQRRTECEPILKAIEGRIETRAVRLTVPASIGRKPPAFRAQRRTTRFLRYFERSELHKMDLQKMCLMGAWMGAAPSMPPHMRKFISDALGVNVHYGELHEGCLGLVTDHDRIEADRWSAIHEQFHPDSIAVSPIERYKNLLIGLEDASGKLLACGLIEKLDFDRLEMTVRTPLRSDMGVKRIQFGLVRINPDGSEAGSIRPGDV